MPWQLLALYFASALKVTYIIDRYRRMEVILSGWTGAEVEVIMQIMSAQHRGYFKIDEIPDHAT